MQFTKDGLKASLYVTKNEILTEVTIQRSLSTVMMDGVLLVTISSNDKHLSIDVILDGMTLFGMPIFITYASSRTVLSIQNEPTSCTSSLKIIMGTSFSRRN